ncbi:unnamed protein product [Gulo gulo]|uniref:Uncharacterized protein n=1 Tax=Gulo gulo TaxID=48420 RepID=A0A9X9PY23_GULGU|nr:unnamed protein product [Gulo gulo]
MSKLPDGSQRERILLSDCIAFSPDWKKSTEDQFLKRLMAGYLSHPPLLKDFRTKMFPQYDILILSMQMD